MRATLLIVEDEVSLRRLMRLMLEREGFLVRDAGNGLEALDVIAESGLPDLALVDLMMPVMNGQEFVAEVSARGWEMPAHLRERLPRSAGSVRPAGHGVRAQAVRLPCARRGDRRGVGRARGRLT